MKLRRFFDVLRIFSFVWKNLSKNIFGFTSSDNRLKSFFCCKNPLDFSTVKSQVWKFWLKFASPGTSGKSFSKFAGSNVLSKDYSGSYLRMLSENLLKIAEDRITIWALRILSGTPMIFWVSLQKILHRKRSSRLLTFQPRQSTHIQQRIGSTN